MKKFFFLVILTVFASVLLSCGTRIKDPLFYQSKDFDCKMDVSFENGSFSLDCAKENGSLTLFFTSPERLAGVSLISDKEGDRMIFDGLSIPQESGNFLLGAVKKAFSLSEDDISKAVTGRRSGTDLNALRFGSGATLYLLSGSSYPARIEGNIEGKNFTIDITDFEIKN